jgi:hypothetical protein
LAVARGLLIGKVPPDEGHVVILKGRAKASKGQRGKTEGSLEIRGNSRARAEEIGQRKGKSIRGISR